MFWQIFLQTLGMILLIMSIGYVAFYLVHKVKQK